MMVIAHETRHSLQAYDAAKNKITAAGFEMLRSNIFSKYLSDKEYSEYHSNYLHSEIESDANEYGWYFTYKMISLFIIKVITMIYSIGIIIYHI